MQTKKLVDVVKALKITIKCEKRNILTDEEQARIDADWKGGCTVYAVRLTYDGRSLGTVFHQGLAHSKPPTAADVLYCLASDARGVEHATFEDFCSEYGYDTDSRKAERLYEACKRTSKQMRDLFGDETFEEIANAEH